MDLLDRGDEYVVHRRNQEGICPPLKLMIEPILQGSDPHESE